MFVAHLRKCVICFAVYMITAGIIASRFYIYGCLFELGRIITILLLVELFGLKVNSDFTNSSDYKMHENIIIFWYGVMVKL